MAPKKPKKKPKKKQVKRKPSAYNKHIGREMKAGKTMKQAAASWKKKSSAKSSPKKRASNTTARRLNNVSKGFNMSKMYKWVRIGGFALPAATVLLDPGKTPAMKGKQLSLDYFGYNPDDGSFKWSRLQRGWMPGIAATIITVAVPKISSFVRGFLK